MPWKTFVAAGTLVVRDNRLLLARTLLQRLLPASGYPQIVLRIGLAAHPTPPPASPRRRLDTVIEVD